MKYIKFIMSKGESISLPIEKALKILESKEKVIMIYDDNSEWTGSSINKAFLVATERDKKRESIEAEKDRYKLPEATKELKDCSKAIDKMRKDLIKRKII